MTHNLANFLILKLQNTYLNRYSIAIKIKREGEKLQKEGDLGIAVLAKGVEKHLEVVDVRLPADKGLHVVEGPDGLARHAGGDVAADKDGEGPRGGPRAAMLVHLDDELPRDVELADLPQHIDHEVVGVGAVGVLGVVAGADEEAEGDLRSVAEAEEGLVHEVAREADAGELKGGLQRVEGVVVVDEEAGEGIGVGGGPEWGRARFPAASRKP